MVSLGAALSKSVSHEVKPSQVTRAVAVDKTDLAFTFTELILSLIAFILEELVDTCSSCLPLYFFEFTSCTAVLFNLLFLPVDFISYSKMLNIPSLTCVRLFIKMAVCACFSTASIAFLYDNGGRLLEKSAVVFGFLATCMYMTDIGIHIKIRMLMKAKGVNTKEEDTS